MTALRRASSAHIAEDAQKRKKRFTASNYHHVIYSLKKKPGALMNLVYRDDLFPGEEYKKHFEFTLSLVGNREACRIPAKLLAMAHEQSCEDQYCLTISDTQSVILIVAL